MLFTELKLTRVGMVVAFFLIIGVLLYFVPIPGLITSPTLTRCNAHGRITYSAHGCSGGAVAENIKKSHVSELAITAKDWYGDAKSLAGRVWNGTPSIQEVPTFSQAMKDLTDFISRKGDYKNSELPVLGENNTPGLLNDLGVGRPSLCGAMQQSPEKYQACLERYNALKKEAGM